jgi:ubiquinone/menaquinone biosynthesis C-methylase UbiE
VRKPSFDRLAGVYRALEFAAFGRDLERARFCLLDRLASCTRILVFGEGDGRALARLVGIARDAEIHCMELSPAMIDRAARRLGEADRPRVIFHQADALTASLPDGPFDAVTTMFFLDCFTEPQVRGLVRKIAATLSPEAAWLWADFRLPDRGWARLRARATIALLYAFFRWQTGIPARQLPAAERIISDAGFTTREQLDRQGGMVRTRLFGRAPTARSAAAAESPDPARGTEPSEPGRTC